MKKMFVLACVLVLFLFGCLGGGGEAPSQPSGQQAAGTPNVEALEDITLEDPTIPDVSTPEPGEELK